MKPHLSHKGVIVAASAVAAAAASAWELEHRRVQRADLREGGLRIERLTELVRDAGCLQAISRGLLAEWGEFAFLGFESVEEMAAEAGKTTFVVVERGDAGAAARGIVQTILTESRGDAGTLATAFPSFLDLTSRESWKRSRHRGGDTAVLLQITTLGAGERGGGLGSLLRSAVLNMLDKDVHYALTMTPVDGAPAESIDLQDRSTYTAAMRFHARGGAQPATLLRDYKRPQGTDTGGHGRDVIVMRYARDELGRWPERPSMQLRAAGPVEERLTRAIRRINRRRPASPSTRRHRLHPPRLRMSLPRRGLPHVDLKGRAQRLTTRRGRSAPAA